MRVCLICSQIAAWGKIGGFGTNARRLGAALAREGLDVHVVVPRRRGQGRVEQLDGMTVHGISAREVFFGSDVYREVDAAIYHVEEPNLCGWWAQRAMPDRVHLVTSMDPREAGDWWTELRNATWSRRMKYPLQHVFENGRRVHASVQDAHGVYVEAAFLTEKTRRLYCLDQAPGLLPKPVEVPEGPFEKADRPLCVFLGRFDPRKRPERFFKLVERMPDYDFVAVGKAHDASFQARLEKRYFQLPNLRVTGFVDPFRDQALAEILARAWVLVHPAAREGLSTAFQEASAREAAILAYVDPDRYVSRFGRVAPEGRGVAGLEEALRALVESGDWRERGRAGRHYNLENHSIPHSVARHLEEYQAHLAQPVLS